MASRPKHLDLGNRRTGSPSQRDLPSPRSGEVPPALSPLDAFALQGRLLAQQLEASHNNGRRISRLPPLTIANELAKPRPGYFNSSPSAGSRKDGASSPSAVGAPEKPGTSPEVARPTERPVSRYPFIHTFDDAESLFTRDTPSTIKQVREEDGDESSSKAVGTLPTVAEDYFAGTAPQLSADEAGVPTDNEEDVGKPAVFPSVDSAPEPPSLVTASSAAPEPTKSSNSLAPETTRHIAPAGLSILASSPVPSPLGNLRNELGIRPARADNGDDSDSLSIPGDYLDPRQYDRKLSSSSAFSRPRSPYSPFSPYSPVFAPPRSPSISSEHSLHPRGSINFSRPLSRAGKPERRPSFEGSIRSQMADTPPSRPSLDVTSLHESLSDSPRLPPTPWVEGATPLSLTDDESSTEAKYFPNGAPSYIYAKYSLPRGRVLSRNSVLVEDGSTHKFEWQQPRVEESNVTPIKGDALITDNLQWELPESDFRASRLVFATLPGFQPPGRSHSFDDASTAGASKIHKSKPSHPPGSPASLGPPARSAFVEEDESQVTHGPLWTRTGKERGSFTQERMPDPSQIADSLRQISPEGHLAKGIECHEGGELQKSTYHLRLAARGGNATAMLLYALACRHGWGMRANQAEGVSWLKKAVDSTGLEVAVDEEEAKSSTDGQSRPDAHPSDVVAKRTHKAQLALSIYELGVSYMNGWGIGQDKMLALRCFEISGSWGDGDALAEAGFCYAKGVGCKKDLNKAADLYRKAEERGVEMAGNSWIYKDKYMPSPSHEGGDDDRKSRGTDKQKEKKPRDKSRTRTIFGGRRKQPPTALAP